MTLSEPSATAETRPAESNGPLRTLTALIGTFLLALIVGYLQLEVHAASLGLRFGLSETPEGIAPRYPWELQLLTFVLAAGYVAAYLRFFHQTLPRAAALLVLSAVTLFGWSMAPLLLGTPAASLAERMPMPLLALGLGYAGATPFCLTIAAIIAVAPAWRPSSRTTRQSP
jgi:hypothetical protein